MEAVKAERRERAFDRLMYSDMARDLQADRLLEASNRLSRTSQEVIRLFDVKRDKEAKR